MKIQGMIKDIILSALSEYESEEDRISLNRASVIMRMKGYRNPRKVLRQWESEGRIEIGGSRGHRFFVSRSALYMCIAADKAAT